MPGSLGQLGEGLQGVDQVLGAQGQPMQALDGDIADDDEQASFGEGTPVKVVVDPASAQLLQGATLDYKDGLDQSGFAITNPNASRTCGCGQSFS